jgi:hypothetical protein
VAEYVTATAPVAPTTPVAETVHGVNGPPTDPQANGVTVMSRLEMLVIVPLMYLVFELETITCVPTAKAPILFRVNVTGEVVPAIETELVDVIPSYPRPVAPVAP